MAEKAEGALVWVKDNAGNMFLCPLGALMDPNTVSEEDKKRCVDDATRLEHPESVPGKTKLKFSSSPSPS